MNLPGRGWLSTGDVLGGRPVRRLLAALLLGLALPAIPSAATPPAPVQRLVPGQVTLDAERPTLASSYEAMATTPENVRILRALEAPQKAAEGEYQYRLATVFTVPDLDGDRAADLVVYDSTYSFVESYFIVGDVTVTLVSGRTGRQVWRRYFDELALPMLYTVTIGNGRPGLLLVGRGSVTNNGGLRLVALGGRGEVAYDRSVSEADGLGLVQFGGLFDAIPGGGTDILVGRVQRIGVDASVTVAGLNWVAVDLTQAFVLDGRDGTYRAVSERALGFGGMPTYIAGGDHDGDKRDDYLVFRLGVRERGSVTARSISEDRLIWVNDSTPLGTRLDVSGPFHDMVGNAREDVFYWTHSYAGPLLKIPGVTDEMTLVSGSPSGDHGVLLDGKDGTIEWDRWDADLYEPWADVNGDGKVELLIVTSFVDQERGGVRFAMTTGAGNELYEREIALPVDLPLIASAGAWLEQGGDVDADGVRDLWYSVTVGTTNVTAKHSSGFLLGRTGAVITTLDLPLRTTLDGRGDDRYGFTRTPASLSLSPREGRSGRSYWRTTAAASLPLYAVEARGARGRCGGVFVAGLGGPEHEGDLWAGLLDGATGRLVWGRALLGQPGQVTVTPHGGAAARCA